MKNKSLVITIFVIVAIIVLSAIIGSEISSASDYVRITATDYTAVVVDKNENDNGKVIITERLTFDVHAASKGNLMWELWRDLPETWVDGVKVSYNIISVKRLTVDGQPAYLEFEEARKLYWYDSDYISTDKGLGPNKWYHSQGPYDGEYRFECLMLYVDGLYRETTVFEIEYEMYNAVLRYNDCSEIYLSLYSGDTIKYLNSVNGQILIPNGKMPSAGNYDVNTYGTNSHSFAVTESATANQDHYTFSFSLNKQQLKFKPYNQYIEFALVAHGNDKHIFSQFAGENYYYSRNVYDEIKNEQAAYDALPKTYLIRKIAFVISLTILAALVILLIFYLNKKNIKKYNILTASQKFDFYRDIPKKLDATFAGAFAFCKHRYSDKVNGATSAAMLGLVQKKYIDTEKINPKKGWEQQNVNLIVLDGVFNTTENSTNLLMPLTKSEELLLGLIRRHASAGKISLTRFQNKVASDYQYTETFTNNINGVVKSVGMSENYFKRPDYKTARQQTFVGVGFLQFLALVSLVINFAIRLTRLDLAFGAFFILGAGFLAAAVIRSVLAKKYVLLTQSGEDEYEKWRGLYKYLNSETLMKEKTVPEVAIWEDYLIYATAFGISEKVIKALMLKCPETIATNSRILRHPYFRTRAFTRVYVRSFGSSVRSAGSRSRSSGGHGGYGGGGRGGGGGGGGH